MQAEQFYEARRETVEQIIDSTQMSSKAKNYLLEQAVFIHGLCVFFACLFTAAVTMVLSAKLRSPFGVIILVSILLFLPLYNKNAGPAIAALSALPAAAL